MNKVIVIALVVLIVVFFLASQGIMPDPTNPIESGLEFVTQTFPK